ncbi:hypothetical protein [Paenibacillus macquariensis]|uniref:Uncharacterized protein n=1 Tax=Paenibacillus macquariensis TaxID=948756 RepID=A0ABY1KE74_9BACL|nr:hypothetical protein [Paenibacillus macquariensis]MEC0093422.1 hypothetical protein [Paenibacillus macquariensis]SIR69898.1 hypothetical protein SAMN05421578_13611 [Paenibacillus macquariensis]
MSESKSQKLSFEEHKQKVLELIEKWIELEEERIKTDESNQDKQNEIS